MEFYESDTDRPLDDSLISICLGKPPKRYLEIGTKEGDSLAAVLQHGNPELMAICDTWGDETGGTGRGDHLHIEELLKELDYRGEIVWLDGNSLDLVPTLQQTFDLILVDGPANQSPQDLENSWPLLEDFGILIMDHCNCKKGNITEFCDQWTAERDDAKIVHTDERRSGHLVLQKERNE